MKNSNMYKKLVNDVTVSKFKGDVWSMFEDVKFKVFCSSCTKEMLKFELDRMLDELVELLEKETTFTTNNIVSGKEEDNGFKHFIVFEEKMSSTHIEIYLKG